MREPALTQRLHLSLRVPRRVVVARNMRVTTGVSAARFRFRRLGALDAVPARSSPRPSSARGSRFGVNPTPAQFRPRCAGLLYIAPNRRRLLALARVAEGH